jgi:ATP-binding cassette subfamily B (MDR/TAP) protein 1
MRLMLFIQEAAGSIEYSKVKFQYPTRPEVSVLRGLDLLIHPGQMVALVGPSGCGKSTCIQLLQRFYEPSRGTVVCIQLHLKCILD